MAVIIIIAVIIIVIIVEIVQAITIAIAGIISPRYYGRKWSL